jgi:hypothetical protein
VVDPMLLIGMSTEVLCHSRAEIFSMSFRVLQQVKEIDSPLNRLGACQL